VRPLKAHRTPFSSNGASMFISGVLTLVAGSLILYALYRIIEFVRELGVIKAALIITTVVSALAILTMIVLQVISTTTHAWLF